MSIKLIYKQIETQETFEFVFKYPRILIRFLQHVGTIRIVKLEEV